MSNAPEHQPISGNVCPVCKFPDLYEPARTPETGGSLEICSSCGFQPGYDDEVRGISIESARAAWVKAGKPWWSDRPRPHFWNPEALPPGL